MQYYVTAVIRVAAGDDTEAEMIVEELSNTNDYILSVSGIETEIVPIEDYV